MPPPGALCAPTSPQRGGNALLPLPLVGRGPGWGSCNGEHLCQSRPTPHPDPPPQGGREPAPPPASRQCGEIRWCRSAHPVAAQPPSRARRGRRRPWPGSSPVRAYSDLFFVRFVCRSRSPHRYGHRIFACVWRLSGSPRRHSDGVPAYQCFRQRSANFSNTADHFGGKGRLIL